MVNCPMKTQDYDGNCVSCNGRTDCMLQEALQKLRELEEVVGKMKAGTAVPA